MASEDALHDFPNYATSAPNAGLAHLGHGRTASTAHLLQPSQQDTQRPFEPSPDGYNPEYKYTGYTDNPADVAGKSVETLKEEKPVPLVQNVAYQDLEYAEPFDTRRSHFQSEKPPTMFERYFGMYSLEQRIADKKRGISVQRYPIVVWLLSTAMLGVLIYELVVNAKAQGTPVSFKPVVNPMLGPSEYALINLGARFPPCMKLINSVPLSTELPCLNDTANPPDRICPLENICGFGGFHNEAPDQSFRFITAIFLHAGIVHLLLNMLAQLTVSAQVEREMGSLTFIVLYFAAGIFGNVLGGNFALVGTPSVGASGAIFGTTAVAWVDLLAHWKYTYRPVRKLMFMIVELIIGVAIGFIPYIDNFAHLGGLLMGLLVGMVFYPIISASSRHRAIVWCLRLAAIPLAVVLFVVLIRNFYTSDPYAACSWCRYLSCIPTSANNHCQGTGLTTTSSSSI